MYKNQKGSKKSSDAVEAIIGAGAVFEGNVSCEGSMKVEGTLKGDVKVDHTLVVGPNGSVTGDINAGRVFIFGEVNGKIDAKALEIKSTGKITGEILVETLVTEVGGSMRAKCEMKGPAKTGDPEDQVLTVSYSKQ
jgi:cytoskeletal protein CcmA (bactofilin family)